MEHSENPVQEHLGPLKNGTMVFLEDYFHISEQKIQEMVNRTLVHDLHWWCVGAVMLEFFLLFLSFFRSQPDLFLLWNACGLLSLKIYHDYLSYGQNWDVERNASAMATLLAFTVWSFLIQQTIFPNFEGARLILLSVWVGLVYFKLVRENLLVVPGKIRKSSLPQSLLSSSMSSSSSSS